MAIRTRLKEWDYLSKGTDNLKITTKLSDMDNPLYNKILLGYFYNITQTTESSSDTPGQFIINLRFRENEQYSFRLLSSSNNILGQSHISNNLNVNRTVSFGHRIEFKTIQLQIFCPKIRGKFLINDFGIMYREVRNISIEKHDD